MKFKEYLLNELSNETLQGYVDKAKEEKVPYTRILRKSLNRQRGVEKAKEKIGDNDKTSLKAD